MKRIAASLLAVGLLAASVLAAETTSPATAPAAPATKAADTTKKAPDGATVAPPGPVVACRDFAQAPGSRWRLASRQGVAWLVTPCGDPFFSIGINALNGGAPAREAAGRIAYHWGSYYPRLDGWLATTRARAARWGFNTAGASSLPPDVL